MKNARHAFTLIELSIVLVIIGLIVGGVLVGRDLIAAAEIRGVISQKEKFDAATFAFRGKYGQLPGDISPTNAAAFGLSAFTGANAGQFDLGNQNGKVGDNGIDAFSFGVNGSEAALFFRHLTEANLINGVRTVPLCLDTMGGCSSPGYPLVTTADDKYALFPEATIKGTFFGFGYDLGGTTLSGIGNAYRLMGDDGAGNINDKLSAVQDYNIDNKIDDGKPNAGKMQESALGACSVGGLATDNYDLTITTGCEPYIYFK